MGEEVLSKNKTTKVIQQKTKKSRKKSNEVSEEVLKELDAEQCNKCQKEFNSAEELKEHVKKVHPGKDEFFCKICDKSFKLKSNVKKHIKNIHGIQEDRKVLYAYTQRNDVNEKPIQDSDRPSEKQIEISEQ